ncbi:MAG: hypothetical protein HQK52_08850 [Oligoflexia bacterium]|nr:hypothetical protein [Oligoflexia bacterium]
MAILIFFISTMTLLLLFAHSSCLYATEVDSFTNRLTLQKDSTNELNNITNEFLKRCVDEANDKSLTTLKELYTSCTAILGGNLPWSPIENFLNQTERIESRGEKRADSIYSLMNRRDGFALYIASLGHTIRMGELIIGIDKIGHFFQEGYSYYNSTYLNDSGIRSALDSGEYQERTYYGLMTTGVYSYSDLNANFQGLLFWNSLTKTEFNEAEVFKPYIIWKNNQWQQNPEHLFDWRVYVDAGMDESQNCNTYKTPAIQAKVDKRLNQLSLKTGVKMACPMSPVSCYEYVSKIRLLFPDYVHHLVSPFCLQSASAQANRE